MSERTTTARRNRGRRIAVPLALGAAAALAAACLAPGAASAVGMSAEDDEDAVARSDAQEAGSAGDAQGLAASNGVRINEVESNDGDPGDWIEFFNSGESSVDLSGYTVRDDKDDHGYVFPSGTVVAPGAFLVIDELQDGNGQFDFGLGKADSVRLFDAGGASADEYAWTAHAGTTYGVNEAGSWGETAEATKGTANRFDDGDAPGDPADVVLNEIDSQPADWVELFNTGDAAADLTGYELRDNSDDHRWGFAEGTTVEPGAFLVVDENTVGLIDGAEGKFPDAIGIGSTDKIRLFGPDGAVVDDSGAWEGHAEIDGDAAKATLGRCPDGQGDFVLAIPTPGATNECAPDPGDGGTDPVPETVTWPGSPDAKVVDEEPMFLEDSSGLDAQQTDDGTFLWAVDNGEGRFWKLAVADDGTATPAEGWADGKRARFQKDADDPDAKGPDTEGITVAGDGFIYLASERDNGVKGVNYDVVLKVDPEAPGPDVVATQEWDLTALLPQVSANLGIEAVEWVSDADLTGELVDENTGAGFDPASYPQHGEGLFFVAVEDGGRVFAFALNSDGSAQQVAELHPGLAGVMALDWDTVRGGLWAVCDDGCSGASAFFTLDGTADPEPQHFARPEGLPDSNNEGFATAPAALIVDGQRPAWWFTDGVQPGALHLGSLLAEAQDPGDGGDGGEGDDGSGAAGSDGSGSRPAAGADPTSATDQPNAGLANTGSETPWLMLGTAAVALLGAGAMLLAARRVR